jgi:ferritin-like metal-binding protein YciE
MKEVQQDKIEQDSNTSSKRTNRPVNTNEATGLRDLFEDGLKDIYWAEKALTKAMPKMIENATSPDLVSALTDHLAVTEEHVHRLERVFGSIGSDVLAKKCDAMEGLVKEANQIMESTTEGVVRDAGIIAAAQKVEHYEIATYGTLCAFAKILNEDEAASLLLETLNEEKEADDKLSEVAEASINLQAAAEDIDDEELGEGMDEEEMMEDDMDEEDMEEGSVDKMNAEEDLDVETINGENMDDDNLEQDMDDDTSEENIRVR